MRVLVTGSNAGIGFFTAMTLARSATRPTVLLACRTPEKAIRAAEEIRDSRERAEEDPHLVPVPVPLRLESSASVREFTHFLTDKENNESGIDVLVNNAGVFLSESPRDTIQINAVSALALIRGLNPKRRVVNVVTAPHMQKRIRIVAMKDVYANLDDIDPIDAYVRSKELLSLATAHRAKTLSTPLAHVLIGPGAVNTGIHSKFSDDIDASTRASMESVNFHGSPEWAGENVAAAALGAFDIRENLRRTSVVDLGKAIHNEKLFQYDDEALNATVHDALVRAAAGGVQ